MTWNKDRQLSAGEKEFRLSGLRAHPGRLVGADYRPFAPPAYETGEALNPRYMF